MNNEAETVLFDIEDRGHEDRGCLTSRTVAMTHATTSEVLLKRELRSLMDFCDPGHVIQEVPV